MQVLITYRAIPGAGLVERLKERFSISVNPLAGQMSREALIAAVAGADAMVSMLTDRVDAELLNAAPRLRI